mmetsp:Transcript_36757/g.68749  ORF Transcript_36757/g.68749 Transcript_36757/m.68749 type:complete len:209 (-) Transcript_36757:525-1151(-)
MYSSRHRLLGWLSSPITSRSNFTCVHSTQPVGGRKSTVRCRTLSLRVPLASCTTAWKPAQLSCLAMPSACVGIRISAKTPEGACNRNGPFPAWCSSTVLPIGSSRFKRLQTPTYCAFRSCAASSSVGAGRQTRAGGLTAWPSRARATVAAGRSSWCTRRMELASAAGSTRQRTAADVSTELAAPSTVAVATLPFFFALGADTSNATHG